MYQHTKHSDTGAKPWTHKKKINVLKKKKCVIKYNILKCITVYKKKCT